MLAYTLLALWWRWRRQKPVSAPALIDLIIGLTPILALNLGLGLGEEAPPDSRAWLTAALLFQLSRSAPARQFLPRRPSRLESRDTNVLFAAATLLLVAALIAHWQKPGLQRIVGYLPFVLLQQAPLLGFIWPRLVALAPSQAPVVAACIPGWRMRRISPDVPDAARSLVVDPSLPAAPQLAADTASRTTCWGCC